MIEYFLNNLIGAIAFKKVAATFSSPMSKIKEIEERLDDIEVSIDATLNKAKTKIREIKTRLNAIEEEIKKVTG